MKKGILFLIVILYTLCNSGWAVTVKFCGDRISGVSLIADKNSCCCGNKKINRSCCSQHSQWFKINDNQEKADISLSGPHFTEWHYAFTEYSKLCTNAWELFGKTPSLDVRIHTPPDRVKDLCSLTI